MTVLKNALDEKSTRTLFSLKPYNLISSIINLSNPTLNSIILLVLCVKTSDSFLTDYENYDIEDIENEARSRQYLTRIFGILERVFVTTSAKLNNLRLNKTTDNHGGGDDDGVIQCFSRTSSTNHQQQQVEEVARGDEEPEASLDRLKQIIRGDGVIAEQSTTTTTTTSGVVASSSDRVQSVILVSSPSPTSTLKSSSSFQNQKIQSVVADQSIKSATVAAVKKEQHPVLSKSPSKQSQTQHQYVKTTNLNEWEKKVGTRLGKQ